MDCDGAWKGRIFVYCGNDSISKTPSAFATGTDNQMIGWSIASAGDVDGDGLDEIMFSNYAGNGRKVWVCRYTGAGMEESEDQKSRESEDQRLTIHPNPFASSTIITLCHPSIGHSAEGKGERI